MDKQALIDKIEKARALVEEALNDAFDLEDSKQRTETIYWLEQSLGDINFVLNYLNGGDFHD